MDYEDDDGSVIDRVPRSLRAPVPASKLYVHHKLYPVLVRPFQIYLVAHVFVVDDDAEPHLRPFQPVRDACDYSLIGTVWDRLVPIQPIEQLAPFAIDETQPSIQKACLRETRGERRDRDALREELRNHDRIIRGDLGRHHVRDRPRVVGHQVLQELHAKTDAARRPRTAPRQ